jgi:hypothetical protein
MTLATGLAGAALAAAGLGTGLGAGLFGFTVTFDVAVVGLELEGGRAVFLTTATLWVAFLSVAFPGFLAALFGFFEGI